MAGTWQVGPSALGAQPSGPGRRPQPLFPSGTMNESLTGARGIEDPGERRGAMKRPGEYNEKSFKKARPKTCTGSEAEGWER